MAVIEDPLTDKDPSGQDLMVARWLSDPESAYGRPASKGGDTEANEGEIRTEEVALKKALAAAQGRNCAN